MRRTGIALLALVVIGFTVTALALGRAVRSGFSTHEQPSAIEAWVARTVRHWAVPADLRGAANPVPLTPEALASGRAHWADHCATCHGNDGKGQTTLGQNLYPRAPDMTLPATQRLSDGELFAIIENGIRLTGMPGWGNGTAASGKGSWELVHLIRHLPQITPEEIAEMERLNPKSPAEFERMQEEEAFLGGNDHH
ncbi:MAG TPA: c-type cytochrome [Thermoanaerobaculia bacterium]|nr:c-type cytochrome [Thermoanaerobaculia bacterium]